MTLVRSLQETIAAMKDAGVIIDSEHELKPRWLGHRGYVGCPIRYQDTTDPDTHKLVPGKTAVAWIVSIDVVELAGGKPKADSAEWLTLELVNADGQQLSVDDLITRFARQRKQMTRFGETEIEALSMLAYIADFMGFIENERDEIMRLPADHPLHPKHEGTGCDH